MTIDTCLGINKVSFMILSFCRIKYFKCLLGVIKKKYWYLSRCLASVFFFNLKAKEGEKQTVLMRRQKAFHLEAKANQKLSKPMDVSHENDVLSCVSVHYLSVRQLRSCSVQVSGQVFSSFPFLF